MDGQLTVGIVALKRLERKAGPGVLGPVAGRRELGFASRRLHGTRQARFRVRSCISPWTSSTGMEI